MSAVQVQAAADAYERDGYVIFREVIDGDLIAEASDHVEWLARRHPELRPENLGHELMRDDPFWVRLAGDDRLLDIAEAFVGPDIAVFASHYICKPAYSGLPVLWHQDNSGWPLEPMEVVTLWLAVDASTTENGCLRVVPGSHAGPAYPVRPSGGGPSVLDERSDVVVDESMAIDLVLRPGDVEVHHPNILHSSAANESAHRRCGLTIRYIPTSTAIVTDDPPYPSAFLVRGEPGVNSYQPTPRYVAGDSFAFRDAHRYWPDPEN